MKGQKLEQLKNLTKQYRLIGKHEPEHVFKEGFIDNEGMFTYPVLITGVVLSKYSSAKIVVGKSVVSEVKGIGYIPLMNWQLAEAEYIIECETDCDWSLQVIGYIPEGDLLSNFFELVALEKEK